MEKRIEMTSKGLQCDNPTCDWVDETIPFEDLEKWANKPCPKCCENILTDEDMENAKELRKYAEYINSLSDEEFDKLAESTSQIENVPQVTDILKEFLGEDHGITNEDTIITTFSTHKGIKITDIKKAD